MPSPMKLCVGAASRRVVEEAAKLRVRQIVASRRQVGETTPGYTGFTSKTLVERVSELSAGLTDVVRDHGGPYQNGEPNDDWEAALDADVDAGFRVLHLDVSRLSASEQPDELTRLCRRYAGLASIEIGGERDQQGWLYMLLEQAVRVCQPVAAVAAFGGHILADRQWGQLIDVQRAAGIAQVYASHQVTPKAHNMDWLGSRREYGVNAFYNVAPEFGNVEIDAWLRVLPLPEGQRILQWAYKTGAWNRWFTHPDRGTWFERARAALRYHLESPYVREVLDGHDDNYVRLMISDAIIHG